MKNKNKNKIIRIGEINVMRNLIDLIELGVPIGIGMYIGKEFLELVLDTIVRLILWLITKLKER